MTTKTGKVILTHRQLQERVDILWELIGEGPTPGMTEKDMFILLKDIRNTLLHGADGEILCFTRESRFLRDLLGEK